ncbi:signal transduction histidine kinase [Roseimicrobium gellanilyticum]|uniref:histidine kinase n=1 Tax=Roseimicrobium gellanilyticum TaxID=748857 RepID=A0A366H8T3_9BACT|nr:ATP-binding protein [Roseimicrobium gellanilyticum]RBP38649.1 signal transduction histidine kinase [Roseimicrobium gellanilyticum]
MNSTFYYSEISSATARRISELMQRGESVMILGPRGVGKRYLLDLVDEIFAEKGMDLPTHAKFSSSEVSFLESDVARSLANASEVDLEGEPSIEHWAEKVQTRYTAQSPLRIYISNLDGLSKRLAHHLLSSIQKLVKAHVLVTVVTGEGNVIDLVDGSPTSAWSCTHQFVVHAHDRYHFGKFLFKRMRQMGLRFPHGIAGAKRVFEKIYDCTGGNVTLARAVLWSVADTLTFHLERPGRRPMGIEEKFIPEDLTRTHVVPTAGLVPFRYAAHAVHSAIREPHPSSRKLDGLDSTNKVLEDLERMLLRSECIYVGDQPHLLELAGLARRNEDVLEWFCPYAEKFALSWFNHRRLGDYYAFAHDWPNAHRLYEKLSPEERCRPLSDDDNAVLLRLMDGLSVYFHRAVSKAAASRHEDETDESLVTLLRKEVRLALKNLLGFTDEKITCWERDYRGQWVRVSGYGEFTVLPSEIRYDWEALVMRKSVDENEYFGHKHGWHWVVCRNAERRPVSAILVDGRSDPLMEHEMRKDAIFRVFRAFVRARERQWLIQGLEEKSIRSQLETEIFETFWKLTHSGSWDAHRALPAIAHPLLRALPSVSRLVFCEFEHEASSGERRLKPIYDSGFPHTTPERFHAVVAKGRLADWNEMQPPTEVDEHEANELFGAGGLAPFSNGTLIIGSPGIKGVVLLEQARGISITESDMVFLFTLAKRFESVWAQAMRMKVLHQSMDVDHTPKLLLDRKSRIIYANQPAIDRLVLGINSGWQAPPVSISSIKDMTPAQRKAIAPHTERRHEKFEDLTGEMFGWWIRECLPLEDERRSPRGWVVTFRNRSFLFKSFELLRDLEKSTDISQALRILTNSLWKLLDHRAKPKIRIYLIDKQDRTKLVSSYATGLTPSNTKHFESGGVVFVNKLEETAWRCLASQHPQAFRTRTNPLDLATTGRTNNGLEFEWIDILPKHEILEKKPGDVAIDFPLLSIPESLGKLTINLTGEDAEKLSAEFPGQLAALSLVFSDLLMRREKEMEERELQYQKDAQRAMSETAHNLVSRFAALSVFVLHYRGQEHHCPQLKSVTDRLEAFYKGAVLSIRRIKDRVGPVTLKPVPCDLVEVISNAMQIGLGKMGAWSWSPESMSNCLGCWDATHWENTLQEMIHNSIDFAKPELALKVTVAMREQYSGAMRWMVLTYEDNGRGVREEFKKVIFRKQSHREEIGNKKGGGIGLSYVGRVMEAHGGTIEETGEHGVGARFILSVPWNDLKQRREYQI